MGWTVNSLYTGVKSPDNLLFRCCFAHTVPTIHELRRANAVSLFQEFASAQIAAGASVKGLEQEFAELLAIAPSMWSQIKGSRNISDKLARQIEARTKNPSGWLDQAHQADPQPSAAEENFLAVARQAWRHGDAKTRRELLRLVREAAKDTEQTQSR